MNTITHAHREAVSQGPSYVTGRMTVETYRMRFCAVSIKLGPKVLLVSNFVQVKHHTKSQTQATT